MSNAVRTLWRQKEFRIASIIALFGIAVDSAFKVILSRGPYPIQPTQHIFFVVDVSHWPSYAKTWLPLDYLESYLAFLVFAYMLASFTKPDKREEEKAESSAGRKWTLLIAGLCIGTGSLCAGFASIFAGWLTGIEAFILAPICIGIVLACTGGLVWLLVEGFLMIVKLVRAPRVRRFTHGPAATPLHLVDRYLNPPQD